MNNRPIQLSYFNNAGPIDQGEVPNLPDTPSKKTRKRDPLVGIVKNLNARRDMNVTHDFDFWVARDIEISEDVPFAGKLKTDFTNEDNAAIYQYDDYTGNGNFDGTEFYMGSPDESALFGNFFKKVGHAIGGVGKAIGHEASSIAHGLEHAHDVVGKDIGKVAKGAAHDVGSAAKTVGHGISWTAKEGVHLHNVAGKETKKIVKAVAPYWKYVADAVVVAAAVAAEVATAGAATAIILPAAGGLLGALNSIPGGYGPGPEWVPQLGGGDFGAGGPGGGDDGLGDEEDDTGDTGDGLTMADQQQAAEMQQQQGMADAEAAASKKKWMLWGGVIVAVIVAIWFFRRK